MRYLAKSNGYFNFTNRLEALNINYAIGPFVLLGCFLVVYLLGYYLTNAVRISFKEYTTYVSENFVHFLYSFYFFGSRMMFFYIGFWVNSISTSISIIIPFCIFSAIILLTLIKLFYDFHKGNLPKD